MATVCTRDPTFHVGTGGSQNLEIQEPEGFTNPKAKACYTKPLTFNYPSRVNHRAVQWTQRNDVVLDSMVLLVFLSPWSPRLLRPVV